MSLFPRAPIQGSVLLSFRKKKKPLDLPQIQNTLSFYFVNKPIIISELERINIMNSFSSCLFVVVVVVIFGCWAVSQHR